jgi:nucleoid DNA-binding protein
MHKAELTEIVAEKTNLPKAKSNEVISNILDEITNALSRNESVNLVGFGSFSQRHRTARTGRSPKTGEAIQISASNSVGFKAGKALKDAINNF